MLLDSSEIVVVKNYVNGEFIEPLNKEYIDTYDPSQGSVYAKLPDSDTEDINNAVQAAHKAFETWSKTSATERSAYLYRIAEILEKRIPEFAKAESRDQGKTVKFAKTVDIPRSVLNFRYFAGHILHSQESATFLEDVAVNYTQRVPIGVAGLISPWNLPLYLLTWKIAPCLAAGNTCVCKPSEFTSFTANLLCSVFQEAGLPKGVVNMVYGTGPKAGNALVIHPKVPLISFTGGTVTGAKIAGGAAPLFKKLSLELGGKNANIIFDDCNLEECVTTSIRSSFSNQGEICLCGSRIFVQETIYEKFLEKFVCKAKELTVGNPTEENTDVGALISKEHLAKVSGYVDLAKQEGGTILCGGDKPSLSSQHENGYFYLPTIITGVSPDSRVMQEEIFGPVVTVFPFKTEEEAIELANNSQYGLSASVWSENGRRGRRIASQLNVGTVWLNCWLVRDLRMPFGGMKASGVGREGADHSMDFFTELKTICMAN
ncbi:hypothetical protein K7432_004202 [Basidiobolus ranarum]|uniref:Aldehyde dehydrogenase domain-containing protein n=1 Tax=Basidiobolus ranarum TaxID=34480 RepID=A0ABR2WYI7_9FUNG